MSKEWAAVRRSEAEVMETMQIGRRSIKGSDGFLRQANADVSKDRGSEHTAETDPAMSIDERVLLAVANLGGSGVERKDILERLSDEPEAEVIGALERLGMRGALSLSGKDDGTSCSMTEAGERALRYFSLVPRR